MVHANGRPSLRANGSLLSKRHSLGWDGGLEIGLQRRGCFLKLCRAARDDLVLLFPASQTQAGSDIPGP